jgi:hypothetical protein
MPIYVTTRCILNMADIVDSSSEEENECGGNFPNPNLLHAFLLYKICIFSYQASLRCSF